MANRRRTKRRTVRAIDPPLIALVVALALVAIVAYYTSARYTVLSASMSHPYVISPPIRMYIGVPFEAAGQGLQYASVNQTFCPENSTIISKELSTFVYPYYTSMSPGAVFDYTLIYNTSTYAVEGVTVLPPFKLISYKTSMMQSAMCAGYPNAMGNVTMVIQAPSYNLTGQISAIVYMLNKTTRNGI